jgi:hypothetical protein
VLLITALPAEFAVRLLMVSVLPFKSSVAVMAAAGLMTTLPLPMLNDSGSETAIV